MSKFPRKTDVADFVSIRSTLPVVPLPANNARASVETERLLLRPLQTDDINAYHEMRTQPEVMHYTLSGKPDRDIEQTQRALDNFLPPNETRNYQFAICLKETGRFIGVGGVTDIRAPWGWPGVGYQMKREHWGSGLATEFLRAFLELWKALPRKDAELTVDPMTVEGHDGVFEEQIISILEASNRRSERVLLKCGFEYVTTCVDKNMHEEPDSETVDLPIYRFRVNKAREGDKS